METIRQTLLQQAAIWGPRIGLAIMVFLVFWIFAKLAGRMIEKGAARFRLNAYLSSLLARTTKITLIILGIITALGTLGVNVSAMVAGLGLTGFALGFALKDILSNIIAGVLILLYRPFEIGNHIKVSGLEGTVVTVDLRYTELDAAGEKILIPNSNLFTNPITVIG
jgi:small conductance mechanosensitive channel